MFRLTPWLKIALPLRPIRRQIRLSSLSPQTTEEDVAAAFAASGITPTQIYVRTAPFNENSPDFKPFAKVTFASNEEASQAIEMGEISVSGANAAIEQATFPREYTERGMIVAGLTDPDFNVKDLVEHIREHSNRTPRGIRKLARRGDDGEWVRDRSAVQFRSEDDALDAISMLRRSDAENFQGMRIRFFADSRKVYEERPKE